MQAVVFDLDGTLVDSDEALIAPFVALGVPRDEVTFGHPLFVECRRLGLDPEDYLAHYDSSQVAPFAGVDEVLGRLDRWAVCSNKHPSSGRVELEQFGWRPEVALFADAFEEGKELGPVLERLGLAAADILFVGDTEHDLRCARAVGSRFAFAGWNRRRPPIDGDIVLDAPADLLAHLD